MNVKLRSRCLVVSFCEAHNYESSNGTHRSNERCVSIHQLCLSPSQCSRPICSPSCSCLSRRRFDILPARLGRSWHAVFRKASEARPISGTVVLRVDLKAETNSNIRMLLSLQLLKSSKSSSSTSPAPKLYHRTYHHFCYHGLIQPFQYHQRNPLIVLWNPTVASICLVIQSPLRP